MYSYEALLARADSARTTKKPLHSLSLVLPVAIAAGTHPFPFRTRKLSPLAPMVLHGQLCGRVGRCRLIFSAPRIARCAGRAVFGRNPRRLILCFDAEIR